LGRENYYDHFARKPEPFTKEGYGVVKKGYGIVREKW